MSETNSRFPKEHLQYHVTSNIIAASAGTGKTYQLASRYIALLVLGVKPEEIIALTFTRKAAGEFRNRILHALAEGACNKCNEKTGRNELTVRVWDVLSGYSVKSQEYGDWEVIPASNPVALLPVTEALVRFAASLKQYPEELYNESASLQAYYKIPPVNAATFARLLREMVIVLSRLRLTTIDSFFTSLVTTNSMELGMNSAAPLDPADEPRVQAAAIRDYLDAQGAEEHSRDEFLRMFHCLTQGVGNRTLSRIASELKSFLKLYHELPKTSRWGDATAFGDTTQLNVASDAELEEYQSTARLLRELTNAHSDLIPGKTEAKQLLEFAKGALALGQKARKWINILNPDFPCLPELLALMEAFESESSMTAQLETMAEQAAKAPALYEWTKAATNGLDEVIKKLRAGKKWNHTKNSLALKSAIDALQAQEACSDIMRDFKRCANTLKNLAVPSRLRLIADRTAALHTLLKGYSDCYNQRMRAEGRLSFADVARMAKELMLMDKADPNLLRHHVAYRMGGELHHWMLDEFQDTSEDQFSTLSPLLKPIAEDAFRNTENFTDEKWQANMPADLRSNLTSASHHVAGESIFVVGDVKQSIYGFRTGKTEVFERLRTEDIWKDALRPSELKLSFRSSPIIMGKRGFINSLFKALHRVECPSDEVTTCDNATPVTHLESFNVHDAAQDKAGYVEITAVAPPGDDNSDDEATTKTRIYDEIVHVLHQLTDAESRPLHGMSIAILVRSNPEADDIMAYLGNAMPELPRLLVKDTLIATASPLGEILLYFFRWLLHPSDAAALNVVRASFLGRLVKGRAEQAHASWLQELQTNGYAGTLAALLAGLNARDRAANAHTIRQWQNSALTFDANGATLSDWCNHMKNLSIQGVNTAGAVQIMTMHKSKGLEFDAVILPYSGTKAIDETKNLTHFLANDGSSLLLPPGSSKEWPDISPAFVRLRDEWQMNQRKEAYNLLYVAATRARHANYIICHGAKLLKDDGSALAAARSMGGLIRLAAAELLLRQ